VHDCSLMHFQYWFVMLQTVHQARIEQANGSGRAMSEERVLPDHKASLKEKDAELQVASHHCSFGPFRTCNNMRKTVFLPLDMHRYTDISANSLRTCKDM